MILHTYAANIITSLHHCSNRMKRLTPVGVFNGENVHTCLIQELTLGFSCQLFAAEQTLDLYTVYTQAYLTGCLKNHMLTWTHAAMWTIPRNDFRIGKDPQLTECLPGMHETSLEIPAVLNWTWQHSSRPSIQNTEVVE